MTAVLILDERAGLSAIAERRATGLDRYDEVWEGVYVMSPLPESHHQGIVGNLQTYLTLALELRGRGRVLPGCNVSDRRDDWTKNYRCPDVAVYLNGAQAEDHGTHWIGGPDFAVEIVSKDDRTWQKLDFYAQVGTRELLIVERNPWQLTLLRLNNRKLIETGRAVPDDGLQLISEVIPFRFRLITKNGWPTIELTQTDTGELWYAPALGPSAS